MDITVPEAAERTGLSPETIRRWIRAGKLSSRKVGTQHLVNEAHLDAVAAGTGRVVQERAPAYAATGGSRSAQLRARIALDPAVLAGKPVVRGTRISVELVLDYLAAGSTTDEILDAYPTLTERDVRACLAFAAHRIRIETVYPIATP